MKNQIYPLYKFTNLPLKIVKFLLSYNRTKIYSCYTYTLELINLPLERNYGYYNGIETTANLLNSVNAMASSPQCLGIQSIFLILYLFWIISFFFQLQCSSYCLQHKILRKSVQNTNNANKITKYWGLKYIKFHSYHQDISKRKR